MGCADYDGDGDLDLYVVNDGQANALLRNDLVSSAHWIELDLAGVASNRSAIGARARVTTGALRQIREVSGGSGYMSQNSLVLHFGLGAAAIVDSVTIDWPSGAVESHTALAVDRKYTLTEGGSVAVERAQAAPRFQLGAATPNPSHDDARFRFALPSAARARLSIYDVGGRLVSTLIDRELPPGWHAIAWGRIDSRGVRVASGVYLAKLEALGEVRTQKLVLLP